MNMERLNLNGRMWYGERGGRGRGGTEEEEGRRGRERREGGEREGRRGAIGKEGGGRKGRALGAAEL